MRQIGDRQGSLQIPRTARRGFFNRLDHYQMLKVPKLLITRKFAYQNAPKMDLITRSQARDTRNCSLARRLLHRIV